MGTMTARTDEARGMRLLAHSNLGGIAKGGEGIGLHAKGGRRTLFIAHETAPGKFTAVDVTDPRKAKVVCQTKLPHDKVRSNSLSIVDDLMAVTYQTSEPGVTPAGVEFFDISDPSAPRSIGVFDASGGASRGAHYVRLCADGFAYVSCGMPDWEPRRPKDFQFVIVLDIHDPTRPRPVGRWWLPGTEKRDDAPAVATPGDPEDDWGYRPHNITVLPERPDRAYVGYLDGGVVILDTSDRSRPKMISRFDYHPPMKAGFTHTVLPLFDRGLLVVSDEALIHPDHLPVKHEGAGWDRKLVWIMDASYEQNVVPLSTLPMPPLEQFRFRGGRFGAHNIHENDPVPTAFKSDQVIVGAFFNGGVRAYDIADPLRPTEIGSFVPEKIAGSKFGAAQMNDVYVDENRVIYATERTSGGLYVLDFNA